MKRIVVGSPDDMASVMTPGLDRDSFSTTYSDADAVSVEVKPYSGGAYERISEPGMIALFRSDSVGHRPKAVPSVLAESRSHIKAMLGTFPVYMTSCETMWGVLIFLKFSYVTGIGGWGQALAAVAVSIVCQMLSASSLCAIASNGIVRSGGAYFMVIRALGPAVGFAIGLMYYLGMSILAAVEIVGATEALTVLLEQCGIPDGILWSSYIDQIVFAVGIFVILVCLRAKSHHLVHHLNIMALLSLVVGFFTSFLGIILTSSGWEPISGLGLSTQNLKKNVGPSYPPGDGFGLLLIYIYPCFIGIFQGANKVAELRNPNRSIPLGAFGSISTSGVLYIVIVLLLAAVAERSLLEDESKPVLILTAWPTSIVTAACTILVGCGSAISCLDVSPKILASLAADGIIPALSKFRLDELSGKTQEPRRATLITAVIILPVLFIQGLDTVALIASLTFLTMYTCMNLSCFLLSVLDMHNWRPKFRYYHWLTALLGCGLCLTIMFLMQPHAAGVVALVVLGLVVYIQNRGEKKTWGHGSRGLLYRFALSSLLGLEARELDEDGDPLTGPLSKIQQEGRDVASFRERAITIERLVKPHRKSWRPQLLCLVKLDHDYRVQPSFLLPFIQQLKGTKGLTMVASVDEEAGVKDASPDSEVGSRELDRFLMSPNEEPARFHYRAMAERITAKKAALRYWMARQKIVGFAEVVHAESLQAGEQVLSQTCGLGPLRPNTLVVGWPKDHSPERAARLLHFIGNATAFEKALIALKPGTESFPEEGDEQCFTGTMDIWWVIHDGGLLLLVAHLLHQHALWKDCTLRLFTVVERDDNPGELQSELIRHLKAVRIDAEVYVVDMALEEVADGIFCEDWTMRRKRHESVTKDARHPLSEVFPDLRRPSASELELARHSVQVTFSFRTEMRQVAANKLAYLIHRESSEADVCILNLPVPNKSFWSKPPLYMDLVDELTHGLRRTILVHGSGVEVLSEV